MKRSRAYRDLVNLESVCAKSAKYGSPNGIWAQEEVKRPKVCLEANEFMSRIFSSEVSFDWTRSNSESILSCHTVSSKNNSRMDSDIDTYNQRCWTLTGIIGPQQQGSEEKLWPYDISLDLSLSMYLDLDLK
uniref:AlNc14C48G3822 protein n=1 Tax=Albugo laibachii Nc14 TaxID=890382 RepID=F0WAW0_9STRA|nr:AlNc14C48G3822 [Albugo laibachii Nc14]CCA18444.1 AlNc14C50G3967 [Albugo laibachii Nc14]|eukprot:CCA18444.1 AlNc14C50G3967 [Albugo laibachii Nc14]